MDVNIVNVQETVKSQQTITEVNQIQTHHYEHYYQQQSQESYQHRNSRSNLNHSYDPNMCTTAARFTNAFYTNNSDLNTASPSTGSSAEEDLLCYNNVVLLHETAEIGAEAIVGNSELLDESPLPMTSLQTQIHVQEETFVSNYQFMQCAQANSNAQMTTMTIQRSPNGHLYQNVILNEEHLTKEGDGDSIHSKKRYHHHCDVNMYDARQATAGDEAEEETTTNLNNFEIPTQFTFQHQEAQVGSADENSVELMAKFAADLASLSTVTEQYEPMNRQLAIASKDHQRMLLESTMSPLLAAVNDITKRDAELKTYFNQNSDKESTLSSTPYLQDTNNHHKNKNSSVLENRENSENLLSSSDEDDYLLVSDKPVVCRAKASLPTNYLFFGNIDSNTNAPSVYAKKSIPHRTKFGPFEGEIQFVNEIDLDVLHVQTPRYYPLLMIDDSHVLDVTNEDSSNWMRYIRLAQTYRQQNLQILLEDGKIFFKCKRLIYPKEELRVGYHNSYAERFCLPTLEPNVDDLKADYSRMHPWKCFECDKCFTTLTDLRAHLKSHDDIENQSNVPPTKRKNLKKHKRKVCLKNKNTSKYSTKLLTDNSICCKLCRKVFMTNETLKQHILKHQNTFTKNQNCDKKIKNANQNVKSKESKVMYKCNLCSKRFHSDARFQQHKLKHNADAIKPHVCVECKQQCATPAALAAHLRSHAGTLYHCVFCEQKFKYVRDFKKHVEIHQSANHTYQCKHCYKFYNAYHLLRKHIHIFHSIKAYNCDKCNKIFQNHQVLKRHMLLHNQTNSYTCALCNKRLSRKDHLNTHMKVRHSFSNASNKLKKTRKPHTTTTPTPKNETDKLETTTIEKLTTPAVPDCNDTTKCNSQMQIADLATLASAPLPEPASPSTDKQNAKSSPKKPLPATISSSSNRRKQTPTKLKAVELNAETLTYVALSEILSPFIITEKDLHVAFKKPTSDKAEAVVKENITVVHSSNKHRMETDVEISEIEQNKHSTTATTGATQNKEQQTSQQSTELSGVDDTLHLYPFKCHICPHTKFKRRGILVNHFAKVHPAINIDEIEVLSIPIVKQQLMFPCPYCKKTYKLNAKRKLHILKHHPGEKLPISMRGQQHGATHVNAADQLISVGTCTVDVHKCSFCHKQYAARNRLVSHYRKSHPSEEIPVQLQQRLQTPTPPQSIHADENTTVGIENYQQELLEPEINIIPYHLQPPVSPENKLLKLSSAALELSRFDFLNERDRCSNDHLVSNVFADHTAHGELNRLPELFEEASIASIDGNGLEKYGRSIEAQFFEKISKFS